MREFLISFSGNEISIGIVLSIWMVFTAIGSLLPARFSILKRKSVFLGIILSVSFLMPFQILLMRVLKFYFQVTPFEIIGPVSIILFSILYLAPGCILLGVWFSSGAGINSQPARVYYLESAGSVITGIIIPVALYKFSVISVLVFIATLNILTVFLLALKENKPFLRNLSLLLFSAFVLSLAFGFTEKIDGNTAKKLWKPFELIERSNSHYGNISVIKSGDEYIVYQNNTRLFATGLPQQQNEEIVHFGMSIAENPGKVLLIGGGPANIREAFKYKTYSITYIEIDPKVVEITKKYGEKEILENPKLKILNVDARANVNSTGEKYDCVIVDLPAPFNGLLNRYYTREFFSRIKKMLAPEGSLIFSLPSLENYMSDELSFLSSSIYRSLKAEFDNCEVLPGSRNYFIASQGTLSDKPGYFIERMKKNKIKRIHLTDNQVEYLLKKERVLHNEGWIESKNNIKLNSDYMPVSYFYALSYWASRFSTPLSRAMIKYKAVSGYIPVLILVGILLVMRINKKLTYLSGISLVSFLSITLELIVVFCFQVKFGTIYYDISILLAFGMAGITLGSFLSDRYIAHSKILGNLAYVLLFFAAVSLLFAGHLVNSKAVFMALALFSAMPAGIIFTVSTRMAKIQNQPYELVYTFDLLAAAAGSFLTGIFFIPLLGLASTLYLVVFVSAAPVLVLPFNK